MHQHSERTDQIRLPSILKGLSSGVDKPVLLAEGGKVNGPGTGTSDSIPAILSDGEYVVNAQAVRRPGIRALLDRIKIVRISACRGSQKTGSRRRLISPRAIPARSLSGASAMSMLTAGRTPAGIVIASDTLSYDPAGIVGRVVAPKVRLTANLSMAEQLLVEA